MEFGFSLWCLFFELWKAWLSYLWECLSFHGDSLYCGHEAVLSEERAFPAVVLPDTSHSLPHQWNWAQRSPSSELDGNPISWAFSNSQEKELHSLCIKSPQILSFWQDQKWKGFLNSHFRKSTEKTVFIKFMHPDACFLLTLFAFPLSNCIKQLQPLDTEILQIGLNWISYGQLYGWNSLRQSFSRKMGYSENELHFFPRWVLLLFESL